MDARNYFPKVVEHPLYLTQKTKEKFKIVYKIERVVGCGGGRGGFYFVSCTLTFGICASHESGKFQAYGLLLWEWSMQLCYLIRKR